MAQRRFATPSVTAAFAAMFIAGGCAEKTEPSIEQTRLLEAQVSALVDELASATSARAAPDELVIRLAFGEDADLDLYVTDPLAESIYFANRQARSGGELVGDVRCEATPPRIEEVRFASPLPGRYRVGVDHPSRCDGTRLPAAYAISVEGPGVTDHASGTLPLAKFEVIVMEFEVSP